MRSRNTCPVCGYNRLSEPPEDWSICPCCFTQFGYDDATRSHSELRRAWIVDGARWHSTATPRPKNWSASEQLKNIGYLMSGSDVLAIWQGGSEVSAVFN